MPFDRSRYPENWKEISLQRRVQSGWKCERCGAKQGELTVRSKRLGLNRKVVLTVAHTGENRHDKYDLSSLEVLCQACHLKEDLPDHIRHAAETRARKQEARRVASGQLSLFDSVS